MTKERKNKKEEKMIRLEPRLGPSGIVTKTIESPYSSSDEDIADHEDKCCQCGKYQPAELINSNSVYFTIGVNACIRTAHTRHILDSVVVFTDLGQRIPFIAHAMVVLVHPPIEE